MDSSVNRKCRCGCGEKTKAGNRFIRFHHLRLIDRKGKKHHKWKGGRIVSPDGYILLLRPDHHLARKNGYVREHRLVMEEKLGRDLTKEEVVDHINEVRDDNHPDNLELFASNVGHLAKHRITTEGNEYNSYPKYWKKGMNNPIIPCHCFCGNTFTLYSKYKQKRIFSRGHQMRKPTLHF